MRIMSARFFYVYMLAMCNSKYRRWGMPMIWRCDQKRIKILFDDQFVDIFYYGWLPCRVRKRLHPVGNGFLLDIADITNFHISQLGKTFGEVGSTAVYAHYGDNYFIRRRIFAEYRKIQDSY